MAKLQALQIIGIRNFGPNSEDMARIKFSTPMTLFLGQNGCGKTTIIESLKYACTGDVPVGSNNGQSFIHDPKINGAVINKGQVRLKVIDAKGQELVVVKSAQVKQERDKLKFSTLDSAITVKKVNGEQEHLSSRCADIGTAFCGMMGISKPILNYVIFCHQEESLWPLDEGKNLKEKFDKIFDIDNYNKCIELMRKMVKEKTSENKILRAHVDRTQILKDVIEKDRNDLQNKQNKLERMDNDISAKKDQMKPLYDRVQEILDLENNISGLDKQISDKSAGKKLIFEQQKSIVKYIEKEFEGTDEELRQAIADFQQNADVDNKKIADLNNRKVTVDSAKTEILKTINRKQVHVGRLKESKQQHENQVTERSELIKIMSNTLKTTVPYELKDNNNATNAISTLEDALAKTKHDLDKIIAENEKEEKNLQDVVDQMREKKVQAKQGIDYKRNQILEIKKNVKSIKDKLHDLDVNDGELKGFKTKIANIDKDLQTLQSTFNFTQVAANIEKEKKQIQTLETNLEDLEGELKILQKNFNIEYDIENKKQDILKREAQVKKFKNKHTDNFNVLFNDLPRDGIKSLVDGKKQNASRTVQNLTATISKKQSEATKFETEIKMHNRKLGELNVKLERDKMKMKEVCGGRNYKEVSQELYFDIETLQREKGQVNSAALLYEKFIKEFQQEKPCCPVCSTGFSNKQQAVAKIIQTLKDKMSELPTTLKEVEVNLAKAQELYSKVLQVGTVNDEVEDLSNVQIPIVTEELSDLNAKLELTRSELGLLEDELVEPQKILEACNAVIEDAIIIDQNQLEIQRSKNAIETLTLELVNVESKKSRQEVEVEIENMKSELSDIRRSCDTQQKKLMQNKTREQNLREDRSKIIDRQLELQKIMQGKPQLEEQLVELKQSEEKLLNEIEELNTRYAEFSNELHEAEQNKNLVKQTNNACVESTRKDYIKHRMDVQEIKKIQSKIEDYLKNNLEAEFTAALAELVQLKLKDDKLNETKDNLNEAINELTRLRESKKEEFKKLENNVDLRKLRVAENVVGKELEALEKRRGTYNPKTLSNEKRTLEQRWTLLNNEMNTQKGSRNQLDDAIKELERKLNLPENKNAYNEYKKKLVESKIAERATEDLKIYAQALEASIMQFHSDRMKQVNRIIRDYWRQIYRGNDIDYVEIKNEIPRDAPANKRVYNYRVVQMKNGAEIDMRGRCSAGQKVLACLIIRLALAETFSSNCGILALDEPTTNLDRENIVSLSEALARVVNARQAEKNFQLLVITHDEDFLDTLSQVEKVSYYYKVSRNQNGNSIITREVLN